MNQPSTSNPGIRRLCIAVDLKGYHELDAVDQVHAQEALLAVLEQAAESTDVPHVEWSRQPTGDGELGLLPPGIDESRFVAALVSGMRRALHEHNQQRRPHLRVRLVIHQGITRMATHGWGGDAVVTVTRLCDAAPVKSVLAAHPGVPLVVVISQQLFADVIGDQDVEFRRSMFTHVRIDDRGKGFQADAWIHAPGLSSAEIGGADAERAGDGDRGGVETPPALPSDLPSKVRGNVAVAGRDAVGGDHIRGNKITRP